MRSNISVQIDNHCRPIPINNDHNSIIDRYARAQVRIPHIKEMQSPVSKVELFSELLSLHFTLHKSKILSGYTARVMSWLPRCVSIIRMRKINKALQITRQADHETLLYIKLLEKAYFTMLLDVVTHRVLIMVQSVIKFFIPPLRRIVRPSAHSGDKSQQKVGTGNFQVFSLPAAFQIPYTVCGLRYLCKIYAKITYLALLILTVDSVKMRKLKILPCDLYFF